MGAGFAAVGPTLFAVLIAFAVFCGLLAVRPGRPRPASQRLDEYAGTRPGANVELQSGLLKRTLYPLVRGSLRWLARRLPRARVDDAQQKLMLAGNPYALSAIDFIGARLLLGILLGVGAFIVNSRIVRSEMAS